MVKKHIVVEMKIIKDSCQAIDKKITWKIEEKKYEEKQSEFKQNIPFLDKVYIQDIMGEECTDNIKR